VIYLTQPELLHSIARSHALIDGNERLALAVGGVRLRSGRCS
jgi:prophage maintenance system killer protein